jgi:hypothetical protein
MIQLILIGLGLFIVGVAIMEYMEYFFEGTHDSFIDYMFDKYQNK